MPTSTVVVTNTSSNTASKSKGPAFVGPAPKISAPSDIFGAPAFAAGRAFSSTTLDALVCEAHFAPHILAVINQLVHASSKQRLQLLPIADAVAMAMLAAPMDSTLLADPAVSGNNTNNSNAPSSSNMSNDGFKTTTTTATSSRNISVDAWANRGSAHNDGDDLIVNINGEATKAPHPTVIATGATHAFLHAVQTMSTPEGQVPLPRTYTLPSITTYGALFEGLLRGWNLLPLGLYRRVLPTGADKTNDGMDEITDPLAQFVSAFIGHHTSTGYSYSYTGSQPFKNDKGRVSYVYTNPPPDAALGKADFIYVLRPCGEGSLNDNED